MNIRKEENKSLLHRYETYKMYKSGKISLQYLLQKTLQGAKIADNQHLEYFYRDFCAEKGLDTSAGGSMEAFVCLNRRMLSHLYETFKVEVLADSFFNSLGETNLETALEGKSLYDVFGKDTGIVLFPDGGFIHYTITEDGSYFQYHEPGDSPLLQYIYLFGKVDTEMLSHRESDSFVSVLYTTLNILLLKKFGEVETIMVAKEKNRNLGTERVVNKMPFPIHRLDSTWFKTIISTKTFDVRGHWRLQACGKKWKEHKLVFIPPHRRHGFVRRARAVIERVSA